MCWNWQTRWTQNPLVVTPCGFDPRHRHQKEEQGSQELCSSFWLLFDSGVEPKAGAFRKQSCGLFLATGVAAATRYGLRSKTCRPPPLHGRLSRSESTSTPATGKGALAKQDVSTPATARATIAKRKHVDPRHHLPRLPTRRGVRHGPAFVLSQEGLGLMHSVEVDSLHPETGRVQVDALSLSSQRSS